VTQFTTNDLAGLSEVVDSMSHDPTVRFAMLTDQQGRILGHTDPKHSGDYLRDAISQRQLGQPARSVVLYQAKDLIESAAPVLISDTLLGWAWVAGDLREPNQQIAQATRAGIIYTCIAVITGILFALVVASNITRQLRLLLEGADRMARDNLDTAVPLTIWNEVGVLTRAFNRARPPAG
jgi:methyl-accepting chemotaxis protein